MFVVNRCVLVEQTRRVLAHFFGPGCVTADLEDRLDAETGAETIVVQTIQALRARGVSARSLERFGLVVLDEAHGAACDSYLSLLFDSLPQGCAVLGLTATPFRLCQKAPASVGVL